MASRCLRFQKLTGVDLDRSIRSDGISSLMNFIGKLDEVLPNPNQNRIKKDLTYAVQYYSRWYVRQIWTVPLLDHQIVSNETVKLLNCLITLLETSISGRSSKVEPQLPKLMTHLIAPKRYSAEVPNEFPVLPGLRRSSVTYRHGKCLWFLMLGPVGCRYFWLLIRWSYQAKYCRTQTAASIYESTA